MGKRMLRLGIACYGFEIRVKQKFRLQLSWPGKVFFKSGRNKEPDKFSGCFLPV
jgi:hypothetical protein